MAEDIVRTTMGQLWVQDVPNAVPYALGCYTLGDLAKSFGDTDQIMCQDPNTPGKFERKAVTQGPPSLPTTSVEGLLPKARDVLERMLDNMCPVNLYYTVVPCAPKTTFGNNIRGTVVEYARASSLTKSNLLSRDADEASTQAVEFSAMDIQDWADLAISRRTTVEINGIRDITGLPFDRCQGDCGAALHTCDIEYVVCNRTGAASANVLYSADGGVTWTTTSADPFPVSEDISGIESIMIDSQTIRLIVVDGTTAPALTLRIAWADVNIVTAPQTTVWNVVAVGVTNAEFGIHHGALFALDRYHIWCGSNLGRIYFSADGGVTWTDQGIVLADAVRYIFFRDADVGMYVGGTTGASHVVGYTTDGGVHWTAVTMTGPGATVMATACTMHDSQRWFIGFENGTLYYTVNGGATFTARAIPGQTGFTAREAINDIRRVDDFCMWMATGATKTATFWPAAYRTVNGGYDWEYWEATTALAADALYFQSLLPCEGFNRAVVVGGIDAGPLAAIYDIYEV